MNEFSQNIFWKVIAYPIYPTSWYQTVDRFHKCIDALKAKVAIGNLSPSRISNLALSFSKTLYHDSEIRHDLVN